MMCEGGRRVIARGNDADVDGSESFHLMESFCPPSHDIATFTW
jgi:hypothetical protein